MSPENSEATTEVGTYTDTPNPSTLAAYDKPFQCLICYEKFNLPTELKFHCSRHTNVKLTKQQIVSILGNMWRKADYQNEDNQVGDDDNDDDYAKILDSLVERFLELQDKSFVCEICHKKLTCKATLTRHYMLHTGVRPFACPKCPKKFTQKVNLEGHLKRHDNPNARTRLFKCDVEGCGEVFGYLQQWRKHKKDHGFVEDRKSDWNCVRCGKTFATFSGLHRHAMIHTGERPHRCTICYKRFVQRSQLKTHMRGVHKDWGYE